MKNTELSNKKASLAEETMKLCKILYCQKDLPMSETCMCWGWECGEGWYNALRKASCRLEALNMLCYDKYKVRIQADQVKEKFGTLRFYYSVLCDSEERTDAQEVMIEYLEAEADKIIREAEDECYNTCEECGSQIGTDWSPRCETSGWIRYICSRCAETIDKCGYVRTYFKNGAKYQGKTLLQTKEEVDAEHRAIEAKYEAEHDVVHEDDDDEEAVAKKFTEDIMKELHNNENA